MIILPKNPIPKKRFSKDLINDQTFDGLTIKFNSDIAFDGSNGLGENAAQSTSIFIHCGGFNDQRISASLKFESANTAGVDEDIGVMLRCSTFEGSDDDYYYARVDQGDAELMRINGGSFTTMVSEPFSLAQGDWVGIDFTVIGNVLSASFSDGTTHLTISTTDSTIQEGGLPGLRSVGSSIFCRAFTVEEL